MMTSKALVHCGPVLLTLWLCTQSVPIGVDKKQEKPVEEHPESPQSVVSQADAAVVCCVGCVRVSDVQCVSGWVLWHLLWFVLQDTGLHYDRYLREVVEALEKDPHFKEKLKNVNMEELRVSLYFKYIFLKALWWCEHLAFIFRLGFPCLQQGKISKELDFVHHNFRTKLDELKREELSRLRLLIRAKHDLKDGNGMNHTNCTTVWLTTYGCWSCNHSSVEFTVGPTVG